MPSLVKGKGWVPLSRSSAEETLLLSSYGLQEGRCVLDAPVVFPLPDGLDWWCWLTLDHILARKLCSTSVCRERISKAEWVYHSLYNCREVEYGHTANLGPYQLPVIRQLFSRSIIFLDSYSWVSNSCCCPRKQWQSNPGISHWFG